MQAANLQVAVDPGASQTKAVYAVNGGRPKILRMESDVLSLPASSVNHLTLGSGQPEDQAWVKLSKNADTVEVCGFLAKQFLAVERIEMLKYEHALYKFLAVVGSIAARENLDRIVVDAAVLLPYGEINSRNQLNDEIAATIKKYYFQEKLVRGRLNSFHCTAEGFGLGARLIAKYGQDWFNNHRSVILMFGYRNISCMTFNRGMIERQYSATSDLGFVKLIDKVIGRTSGQNRQALTEAVFTIGADVRTDHSELQLLVKSTKPKNALAEAEMLVNAITLARQEYWQLVQSWLDVVIPGELTALAVSGGTALYLKELLDEHLSWTKPDWLAGQSGELSNADSCTQFRFADVMAFFESTSWIKEAA